MVRIDIINQKYSRLLVIDFCESKNGKAYWKCKCDCGNETIVVTSKLRNGHTQSCGCLQKERTSKAKKTHGCSGNSVEYQTWKRIRQRCYNPNNPKYIDYGGRGITVCDRWLNSFEDFLLDMGKRDAGYSIERIDNNKNYEPSNCKWILMVDQSRNTRNSRIIEYRGEKKIVADWCRQYNIPHTTFLRKLKLYSPEIVITEYVDKLYAQLQ